MALRQTLVALGITPMPTPKGSEVVSVRFQYNSADFANLALNDVVELGFLPEECMPVDWVLDADDLDSNGTPTIVLDFGILNAGKTAVSTAAADGNAKWLASSTIAQAGGVVRPTTVATWRCTPSTSRRSLGLVATTGPATFQAGKVGVTFRYRAAFQGL